MSDEDYVRYLEAMHDGAAHAYAQGPDRAKAVIGEALQRLANLQAAAELARRHDYNRRFLAGLRIKWEA